MKNISNRTPYYLFVILLAVFLGEGMKLVAEYFDYSQIWKFVVYIVVVVIGFSIINKRIKVK